MSKKQKRVRESDPNEENKDDNFDLASIVADMMEDDYVSRYLVV